MREGVNVANRAAALFEGPRTSPGITSPHAVIFHSFAVPPASTSSKPEDVSTP